MQRTPITSDNGKLAERTKQPMKRLKPEPLDARQKEIMERLSAGVSNKEIAALINMPVPTFKIHLALTIVKLGARNREHAIAIFAASISRKDYPNGYPFENL